MSICLLELLALQSSSLPTSAPATAAVVVPLSTYGWAVAQSALMLAAAVALFRATYGRSGAQWSPLRVTEGRSAGPLWVIGAAMVWCFIALPVVMRSAVQQGGRPLSDGTLVSIYGITCIFGLAAAAMLHFAFRRGRTIQMLGVVPLRTTLLPGRMLVAAAIALPLTYLAATLTQLSWQALEFKHEPAHAMLQLMQRNESTPWVVWVTILNAALLAPVFEEVLFRGHLQTALTSAMPRWAAIVLTSLLFTSMHDAWTAPPIFVLSVAIGVAYEWSGSLWVAIGVHVVFNAVSTAKFLLVNT